MARHKKESMDHGVHAGKGGVEVIGKSTMKKMTHHLGKAKQHHEKAMHHTSMAHELSGAMPPPGEKGGKVLKHRMY